MFRVFQFRRLTAIVVLLLAGFGCLLGRLYQIQVGRHEAFLAEARAFSHTTRVLEARRGEIRDRNGKTLAISTPVKTVYLNPGLCSDRLEVVARTVGHLLRIPPAEVAQRIGACLQSAHRGGVPPPRALVLRHQVPVQEWRAISSALQLENFGFRGPNLKPAEQAELRKLRQRLLFAREAQRRCYPAGEGLGQVLGFLATPTNVAGASARGVSGIEGACHAVLAGTNGFCLSRQDVAGNELPSHRARYESPRDGDHVVLTIDLRVQRLVAEALAAARLKYQARSASAIILIPQTCEILAAACCPGLNLQDRETWRNAAFADMVEPGSILKFIPLAAALEQGLTTLDSSVYCEQGRFVVNRVAVQDHAPYGLLTMRQGFARSSNIAFTKTVLALGPQKYYRWLTNFGLAHRTGVLFAAETPGRIEPPEKWTTMTLTRAAFGQGLSVSQLQMAVAMGAIANGGRLMRPWLVRRIESPQGRVIQEFGPQMVRAVISPQTALKVKEALKAVVSPEGTGSLAALARYTVAAKTGTAQKSTAAGYQVGRYYSSMVGFFPADAPRVVIAIALDEPQNGYYAGAVVAPVFRAVAEQIAACLEIPPDKPAQDGSEKSERLGGGASAITATRAAQKAPAQPGPARPADTTRRAVAKATVR